MAWRDEPGWARLLRRLAPLLAGVALMLAALLLAARSAVLFGAGPAVVGTDLGGTPAPDFRLTNQDGQPLALTDLRGKPVVLTFLYTTCPDICPLVASKLGQVHDRLGDRASQVAFVAITVDPERDSVARVRQYLQAQNLMGKLTFLTGERSALEAVWSAYFIGVRREPAPTSPAGGPGAYSVGHNDALYLLDKQGRERVLLHEDVALDDLQRNLEVLLRE